MILYVVRARRDRVTRLITRPIVSFVPRRAKTNAIPLPESDSSVAISAASDVEMNDTSDPSSVETCEARDDGRVDARESSALARTFR